MRAIIPVIDIAPFLRADDGAADVVEAVRTACADTGFFVIRGHRVSAASTDAIAATSRAFFDLPDAEKARIKGTGDEPGGLMYFPLEAEALAAGRGVATPGDLKQSLDYGPGFGGSAWPAAPAGLHAAWLAYYAEMEVLAGELRRIFALAIGLPEGFFDPFFDRHHSSLRVLDYPDQASDPEPGQLRAGEHTDYGVLTILRSQSSSGGLQAQSRAGEWVDVPAIEGTYVINIADALMRWTNDAWRSTPHRVVNPPAASRSGSRRQSIAFFHNPNVDAEIACLDAFCTPANPRRYEPVVYGQYAEQRYRSAHGLDGA